MIAGKDEIGMQGMRAASLDGTAGRVQGLPQHLAAKDIGAAHEMALAPVTVRAELLQLQQGQDFVGIEEIILVQHEKRGP